LIIAYSAETGEQLFSMQSSERIETSTVAVSFSTDPSIAIGYSHGQIKLFDLSVCFGPHLDLAIFYSLVLTSGRHSEP
jgi:hypothetical protein